MDKKIKIMDYDNNKVEITIKDFEKVKWLYISVVTGDEILFVTYEDGTEKKYDSDIYHSRIRDYHDGGYILYEKGEIDRFKEFNNRKTSYDIEY